MAWPGSRSTETAPGSSTIFGRVKWLLPIGLSALLMVSRLSLAQSSLVDTVIPTASPLLLVPGTTLRITVDSVYLVSKERYRFYQKLHRYLADSTTSEVGSSLMLSYQKSLQETQHAYHHLLHQYRRADSVSSCSMYRTQVSLGQVSRALDQVQYSLEQTTHTLSEVKEQLRREQRRSFFRRLAYGAGGVGVGMILVGILAR